MTTTQKFIDKVGLEIEGGFADHIQDEDEYDGYSVHSDGSISNVQGNELECVTVPLFITKVAPVLEDIYSNLQDVNSSCGLHIHVSLKKKRYYEALTSRSFYDYCIAELKTYARRTNNRKLLARFENSYCKEIKNFPKTVEQQITARDKISCRYHAVNFCYTKHGTVEFRMFNAVNTAGEALEYLTFLTTTINTWLSDAKNRRYRSRFKIKVDIQDRDTTVAVTDYKESIKEDV